MVFDAQISGLILVALRLPPTPEGRLSLPESVSTSWASAFNLCEYNLSNVLIFQPGMELSKEVALKYLELQALEQGISDREDEFFKRYLKSLGISEPEQMNEVDADKLLENLATEQCSEEFVQSLIYWLLRQNISQAALDAILESDIDGDGVPLWQELVEGTNPFVKDHTPVQQSSPELKWSRKNDLEL